MTTIKTGEASFGADTLLGCALFLNSQGVRHVDLKWTWNREILLYAPDRCPFTHEGSFRARWVGRTVDAEYSYIGVFDMEAFSEFAQGYSCWDDADLAIVDGTLVGSIDEYDPDAHEFPDEDEEILVVEWDELGLAYYEYWDEAAQKWRKLP